MASEGVCRAPRQNIRDSSARNTAILRDEQTGVFPSELRSFESRGRMLPWPRLKPPHAHALDIPRGSRPSATRCSTTPLRIPDTLDTTALCSPPFDKHGPPSS